MSDNLTWLSDDYGDLFGQTLIHFLKGGLICSPAEYFTHRTLKRYILYMREIYTLCLFIGGYRISFIFHSIFILQLLRETPPDGEKFAKAVEVTTLFSKWNKLFYSTQVWTSNFFYVEIISPNDFLLWFAQHILEREENWISWKNEGCPTFIKERYKIKLVWKFCVSFVE